MNLENLEVTPFHITALVIFILAVLHTFFASSAVHLSHKLSQRPHKKGGVSHFFIEGLHLLGQVEIIFGLWVLPLFVAIFLFYDLEVAIRYINSRNFVEPMFVVVIMAISATRPILLLAEKSLQKIAAVFGGGVKASWFTILIITPLLGSVMTEPGAMTLAALLLIRRFFIYEISKKLSYATLGLLFTSVSVGGALTSFAAPPVLIISRTWGWDSLYMLQHFGWKVILGISLSTTLYFLLFFKEFRLLTLQKKRATQDLEAEVPFWVIIVHLCFLIALVIYGHNPPMFIGSFLLFLGFYKATACHQFPLKLKEPVLVGVFLAGLIIHGGLQAWWIVPLLEGLRAKMLMTVGMMLTPFNDNTAVVYLASLVPRLTETAKLSIVSGVLIGGGLTVIANAPNPAGQTLLSPYFHGGISPIALFLAALLPTSILYAIFYVTI